LTTPEIVKPLGGAPYWCLAATATGTSGAFFYTTLSGYVASGSFTPPITAPPPGSLAARRGTR